MQEENKLDTANLFFTDNYSIFDSSSEFFQQYKNDYDNKETQKNNFPSIFNEKNISTNNQEQDIKRSESITEINKCDDEKKNNIIPNNILLKVYKQKTENNYYRKDAHYKHFKAFLGKYIKNKINELKNKCFPYYSKNNFSTPNYRYTGNPKEKDNFYFLNFSIKDILIYGKDNKTQNRQYNNELLIKFIEANEHRTLDENAYVELINFLNEKLENIIIRFYDDEIEYNKLKNDFKYIKFDIFFKRETGISLLEKYGFLKAIKKYNAKNEI